MMRADDAYIKQNKIEKKLTFDLNLPFTLTMFYRGSSFEKKFNHPFKA
jgi:hypothetical protein